LLRVLFGPPLETGCQHGGVALEAVRESGALLRDAAILHTGANPSTPTRRPKKQSCLITSIWAREA